MPSLEELIASETGQASQPELDPKTKGMIAQSALGSAPGALGTVGMVAQAIPTEVLGEGIDAAQKSEANRVIGEFLAGGIQGEGALLGGTRGAAMGRRFGPVGAAVGGVIGAGMGGLMAKPVADVAEEVVTGETPPEQSTLQTIIESELAAGGGALMQKAFTLAGPTVKEVSKATGRQISGIVKRALTPLKGFAESLQGAGKKLTENATTQRARIIGAEFKTAYRSSFDDVVNQVVDDGDLGQKVIEESVQTLENDGFFSMFDASAKRLEQKLIKRKGFLANELNTELSAADDLIKSTGQSIQVDRDSIANKLMEFARTRFLKSDLPVAEKILKEEVLPELRGNVTLTKVNDLKRKLYDKIRWTRGADNRELSVDIGNVFRREAAKELKDQINSLYEHLIGKTVQVDENVLVQGKFGEAATNAVNRVADLNDKVFAYMDVGKLLEGKVGHEKATGVLQRGLRSIAGEVNAFFASMAVTGDPATSAKVAAMAGLSNTTAGRSLVAGTTAGLGNTTKLAGQEILEGLPRTTAGIIEGGTRFTQILARIGVESAIIEQADSLIKDAQAEDAAEINNGPAQRQLNSFMSNIIRDAPEVAHEFGPSPIPGIKSFFNGKIIDPEERELYRTFLDDIPNVEERARAKHALNLDGTVIVPEPDLPETKTPKPAKKKTTKPAEGFERVEHDF